MALSTLSDLKTALTNWSKRTDLSSYYDDMIVVAENWIFRNIRVREMESALSGSISSGSMAIPSDFIALKYLYLTVSSGTSSTVTPILTMPASTLYQSYPYRATDRTPKFVAIDNGYFVFGPYPDTAYTVSGTYYAKQTSLLTTVNDLFTNYPDLYLVATMAELEGFIKNDPRIGIWTAKRDRMKEEINGQSREALYNGSPLRAVPRNIA